MATRERLGKQLIKAGKLTGKQLDYALAQQAKTAQRLGSILIEHQLATPADVGTVLANQFQHPAIDLATVTPSKEALARIPRVFAKAHHVLPLWCDHHQLVIAVCDPTHAKLISRLADLTGMVIDTRVCPQICIDRAIEIYYTPAVSGRRPATAAEGSPKRPAVVWKNSLLMEKIRQVKARSPLPRRIKPPIYTGYSWILLVSILAHFSFGWWMFSMPIAPHRIDIPPKPEAIRIAGFFPEKQEWLPAKLAPEPAPAVKIPLAEHDVSAPDNAPAPEMDHLPRDPEPTPAPVGKPDGEPSGTSAQEAVGGGDGNPAHGVDVGSQGVLKFLTGKDESGKASSRRDVQQDVDRALQQRGKLTRGGHATGSETGRGTGLEGEGYAHTGSQTSATQSVRLGKNGTVHPNAITALHGSGTGGASRSRTEIQQRVAAYLVAIRNLYNQELKTSPTLAGRLVIEFTILANGTLSEVHIRESTLNHDRFEQDVLSRVKRWRFNPIPAGVVTVVYPFDFYSS
ncbi:MAG: TonB family protein [Gemmatimonadetes bacterium]|nr:MAG: TonB family protein [Gemmatimonadota bacterium]